MKALICNTLFFLLMFTFALLHTRSLQTYDNLDDEDDTQVDIEDYNTRDDFGYDGINWEDYPLWPIYPIPESHDTIFTASDVIETWQEIPELIHVYYGEGFNSRDQYGEDIVQKTDVLYYNPLNNPVLHAELNALFPPDRCMNKWKDAVRLRYSLNKQLSLIELEHFLDFLYIISFITAQPNDEDPEYDITLEYNLEPIPRYNERYSEMDMFVEQYWRDERRYGRNDMIFRNHWQEDIHESISLHSGHVTVDDLEESIDSILTLNNRYRLPGLERTIHNSYIHLLEANDKSVSVSNKDPDNT